jgi:LysM repeat protein
LAAVLAVLVAFTSPGRGVLAAPGQLVQVSATYAVQAGDTLYGIAAGLGISAADTPGWIDSVVKLNGLADPDKLSVGDELELPGAATGGGSVASTRSGIAYVVQQGDTLAAIGTKLGVNGAALSDWIAAVAKLNALDNPDKIGVGRQLVLPQGGSGQAPSAAPSLAAVPPPPSAAPLSYTVQPGDTLAGIADKLGVGSDNLKDWIAEAVRLSGLDDADSLRVGQVLQLPARGNTPSTGVTPVSTPNASTPSVAYTIQAGDTIYSVGEKLGISGDRLIAWVDQVLRLSGIASTDLLHEGQVIQIPVAEDNAALIHAPQSSGSGSSADIKTPAPPAGTVKYTVRNGDTLSSIGDSRGVSAAAMPGWVDKVLQLNDLSDADKITVGQVLLLPSSGPSGAVPGGLTEAQSTPTGHDIPTSESSCFYTVRSGDTWASIASKLGVPAGRLQAWAAEVAALNGIDPALLPVGDALRLPC